MESILKLSLVAACALGALSIRGAAAEPLTVDASARRAPISPYLYGQFTEHLGRCIYGGIWAEMLEDRKFFFPVTADYHPYQALQNTPYPVVGASPWEILGDPAQVTMVTAGAFVGRHSPRLAAGAGIRQRDLAVVAGRGYTGYLWARAEGAAPGALTVTLAWGAAPAQSATVRLAVPASGYARLPFAFTAGESSGSARLEITAGPAAVLLGTVSLMPADNVDGMRRDTLELLRQLGATVYRWPGGNFVSGYEWRDGIGDRDRRPPRKNPAWTGVEPNDYGTDEFIRFCRAVGAEPLIAANTGFGDAYSAGQWVEYCNGAADTLAGSWRAKHGAPQPYGVKFWCVGNEMFGTWQLGYMALDQYILKHNRTAEAMRAADPHVVLIAVGDIDGKHTLPGPNDTKREVSWSQGMLEGCADSMDLISEHFYEGRVPWNKQGRLPLLEHVTKLRDTIRHKAEAHRALQAGLPGLHGRIVPISMDEWNYWHRDYVYGELGCVYDLADGLGVAEGLQEYFRNTDIIHMAFYAQTVNVIGCIKTSKTAAEFETTGLVLKMYRDHFGTIPLTLPDAWAPVDVTAALTADGRTLTIGVVNPTAAPVRLPLALRHAAVQGRATRWLLAGGDEFAHNTPGEPRRVDVRETADLDPAALELPALSCAIFAIPVDSAAR